MEQEHFEKPIPLPVFSEGIPTELKEIPQWVCWTYWQDQKGEWRKPPVDPKTGRYASPTNPRTWSSFEAAMNRYKYGGTAGVGFVLTASTHIIALDFDNAIEEGRIKAPYARFVTDLHTTFERSPSGRGLRGFFRGRINGERRKNPGLKIEVYNNARFVTVTGHHFEFTPSVINSDQSKFDEFYNEVFPPQKHAEHSHRQVPLSGKGVDEIIELASRTNAKFRTLMAGNWQSVGFKSKSEADWQLLLIAGFYTNYDPAKMEAIFRRSPLCDEKWDARRGDSTYGRRTIQKIVDYHRH